MTKRKVLPVEVAIPGEEWRVIPRAEHLYEASSIGRIRRIGAARALKARGHRDGYLRVDLCCNAQRQTVSVHTLVCEAFHGPRPAGFDAAHRDGAKTANTPENLIWATRAENVAHKKDHGTQTVGEAVANSVLTADNVIEIRARHAAGETGVSIARVFGIRPQTVAKIVRRERWAHIPPA